MNKILKRTISIFCMLVFMLVLLGLETYTFAWLSTSWNGGDFALTAAYTNTPLLEMWTYHETVDTEGNPIGWYKTYGKDTSTDNSKIAKEKQIDNIRTESNGATTFTKSNAFSLYFGAINNLVQDQENVSVYLKFTIILPGYSSNEVKITYNLPDTYVRPYLVNTSTKVGSLVTDTTANNNLASALNNITNYPFLKLQYYYNKDNNIEYSIDIGKSLSDEFVALFNEKITVSDVETTNPYLFTKEEGDTTYTMLNNTTAEKKVYMYFKFSVPTSTLQKALLETELKSNMPIYLIFDTEFSVEVKSVSQ